MSFYLATYFTKPPRNTGICCNLCLCHGKNWSIGSKIRGGDGSWQTKQSHTSSLRNRGGEGIRWLIYTAAAETAVCAYKALSNFKISLGWFVESNNHAVAGQPAARAHWRNPSRAWWLQCSETGPDFIQHDCGAIVSAYNTALGEPEMPKAIFKGLAIFLSDYGLMSYCLYHKGGLNSLFKAAWTRCFSVDGQDNSGDDGSGGCHCGVVSPACYVPGLFPDFCFLRLQTNAQGSEINQFFKCIELSLRAFSKFFKSGNCVQWNLF